MLAVRLEDITGDDIERLVRDRISERKTLDYKEKLGIENRDDTASFLAHISSFANAAGGDMIFGVADERAEDGNATGIPEKIIPLEIQNRDALYGRISQLIETGIQPRIPGVQVRAVPMAAGGYVLIIRIPRSWVGPHMVNYANRTRFFSRTGISGRQQLDVQQIGLAFAQQRGLGERLRAWKTDRISKAISGEGPVPLEGSRILLHFVSASALADGGTPLPRIFDTADLDRKIQLLYISPDMTRYNADGLLFVSRQTQEKRQSYLQVFRDGSLEYGDSGLMQSLSGHVPSQLVERKLIDVFRNSLELLKTLDTPLPVFLSMSLTQVKGRQMALPQSYGVWNCLCEPFDRDVIIGPDILIERLDSKEAQFAALLPVVNSMWQAAGLEQTPYYSMLWETNEPQ